MGEPAVVLAPEVAADITALTLGEEAELRAFFMLYVPPAPGSCSSFGAMCTRVANIQNRATTERPTPGAPWTEIVDCGRAAHAAGDSEDGMIAHVDALRRMQRVRAALGGLAPHEHSVLAAHYSGEHDATGPLGRLSAVAMLTSVAVAENRRRAVRDRHETVEETLASVAAAAKRSGGSTAERARARAIVDTVRRGAAALLDSARTRYASARRGRS